MVEVNPFGPTQEYVKFEVTPEEPVIVPIRFNRTPEQNVSGVAVADMLVIWSFTMRLMVSVVVPQALLALNVQVPLSALLTK